MNRRAKLRGPRIPYREARLFSPELLAMVEKNVLDAV
jgi:hypothetical protein